MKIFRLKTPKHAYILESDTETGLLLSFHMSWYFVYEEKQVLQSQD